MFVITSEACRMIELTYFLKGHVFNFFIKKLFLKTVQHGTHPQEAKWPVFWSGLLSLHFPGLFKGNIKLIFFSLKY